MDFSQVKSLTIPEGEVTKITDSSGRVLWQKSLPKWHTIWEGSKAVKTAANNVIFLDEPWNKSLKDQAIDRAHRIGSKRNINIYTLICRNTFDESVHNKVIKKGITFSNVVDGIDLDLLFKKFGIQNF